MNAHNWKAHNTQGVKGWAVAIPHPSGDGSFYAAIADGMSESEARFMALAVNSHEALVAALAKIHNRTNNLLSIGDPRAREINAITSAALANVSNPPAADTASDSAEIQRLKAELGGYALREKVLEAALETARTALEANGWAHDVPKAMRQIRAALQSVKE